jgi:hypothetical protein
MGEKKTTVFEINVENLDFSPSASGLDRMLGDRDGDEESSGSKLGLFGSSDEVDEDVEIDDEEATEVDVEDEDEEAAAAEDGGGIGLVIGLLFLLIVAVVAKKFVLESESEEYEEVDLSDYEN